MIQNNIHLMWLLQKQMMTMMKIVMIVDQFSVDMVAVAVASEKFFWLFFILIIIFDKKKKTISKMSGM